ncbi:hypothetical protein DPMN_071680 [Dreissena polymorpha]|uniref:C2H2-type domain-containing protein n=1 Tax=Dreissena polymorpha TaxID=45954 RepID=A0A9D3Z3D9_DREPO|nr:hypothetical protein DPMN_071680 [Dreissena polymorpha]
MFTGLNQVMDQARALTFEKMAVSLEEERTTNQGAELCGQCGLAVRSEKDLREHVNTHMHDKCYSSEECFKTYKRKTNLSRYIYYYYYYYYY